MLNEFMAPLSTLISNVSVLVFVLTVVLHIIFASGVARDIHHLDKRHLAPQIIPGYAWVLATLLGGVLTLALYWLIHHSTLAFRSHN